MATAALPGSTRLSMLVEIAVNTGIKAIKASMSGTGIARAPGGAPM